jgi:hypothetical protein
LISVKQCYIYEYNVKELLVEERQLMMCHAVTICTGAAEVEVLLLQSLQGLPSCGAAREIFTVALKHRI